jgi:O-antigen/teichoic acid export membrane protein
VLLFGKSFSGSAAPLQAILPAKISSGLYMLLASFLVVKGYFKPLLVTQGLCLVFNVGLNALLVNLFGAVGAAWAATFSCTLGLIFMLCYMGRTRGLRLRDALLPKRDEIMALLNRLRGGGKP